MKAWMIAAVVAGVAGAAQAQGVQEWPITIQPVPGNEAGCSPGPSGGRIQAKDGALSLVFPQFPEAIWTITPAADGSFDAVTKTLADVKGTKITVPKGSGPRPIDTMQQSKTCGYRLVPAPA